MCLEAITVGRGESCRGTFRRDSKPLVWYIWSFDSSFSGDILMPFRNIAPGFMHKGIDEIYMSLSITAGLDLTYDIVSTVIDV